MGELFFSDNVLLSNTLEKYKYKLKPIPIITIKELKLVNIYWKM